VLERSHALAERLTLLHVLDRLVEDLRRGDIECRAPDINRSSARFIVEDGAVRYALGALKGVGDKAMEAVVGERARGGDFTSLEDFAARIDPRWLNRRQVESLAEAGAFDALDPDRAAVFAGAELILAHAASLHDQKTTGQAALFGGEGAEPVPIRLPRDQHWTLAQRMAAERDSFGYYYSAHPVEAHRHLLAAHKVKTFAEIGEMRVGEGERVAASMAALVEDVRWRTSARGRRYMMATLSDSSGQYVATAFDDQATSALEAAARDGGSGLLTVELDRRAGDEVPRVTVKRFQPLASLAKRSRLQMIIRVADESVVARIADELEAARGGNGLVRLVVRLAKGGEASLVAGRDFTLDAELSARIERIAGEDSVELSAQEPAKLALVG